MSQTSSGPPLHQRPGPESTALRQRLTERFTRGIARFVPDPLEIAIVLLVLTFVLGVWIDRDGLGFGRLCDRFFAGMFEPSLLAFGFQIALILVAGATLADAPPVRRALAALAASPRTERGAAVLVGLVATVLGALNWGLSLIGGAILARAVLDAFAARGQRINGGLIGAAGYLGLAVWHGGLSGSAPLAVAGPPDPRQPLTGVPLTETVLSPRNLALWAALLVIVPLVLWWLAAKDEDGEAVPSGQPATPPARPKTGPAGVLLLLALLVPLGLGVARALSASGAGAINLGFIIAASFLAGLVLHGSLRSFGEAFERGAAGAGSILLQFPIYFGLLAVARDSGLLAETLRAFLAATDAVATVLPREKAAALLTYVSACVVNFFVPSGGAQWALQGPLVAETARAAGAAPGPLVMAMAYGDQCTNLLQPFWALPLLAITRLRVGDLLGWCAILCGIFFLLFGLWVIV
jgi:short-chain fatty acids transporter